MKKIVVLGPESTGKSTLCAQLAAHYETVWCPEFAREYLKGTQGKYSYGDLLEIARGQLQLEDARLPQAKDFYFIDTDMYVMKVWCEVVFENCHTWILRQIASRRYDFYLLCDIDLPWVRDELREYPDLVFRKKLFKMYRDLLIAQDTSWSEISGTDAHRLQMATSVLDSAFANKK